MSFCMFTQCDQVIRVEPVLGRTSRRAGEPRSLGRHLANSSGCEGLRGSGGGAQAISTPFSTLIFRM